MPKPSVLTREILQDLAALRLEEAHVLFVAGQFDGCVYLCGYVLEMALKAVVCRHLDVANYPHAKHFLVHKFDDLALFAGIQTEATYLTGPRRSNWLWLTRWDVETRYKARNTYTENVARAWLEALENKDEGVLPWLTAKW